MKITKFIPALAAMVPIPATVLAQGAAGTVATGPDSGDTAWMLVATALVAFMILPGIALFYGGLVRAKNALSILTQTAVITAAVMVIWVVYGYSMAFGGADSRWWGGLDRLFLAGIGPETLSGSIPEYVFVAFQMTFAALTPVLIIGGFAERVRLSGAVVFAALWVTLVYFPVAHMAWAPAGLFAGWGAMDFAGGTVVHINAGIAALVGALVIGPRIGLGRELMAPHSLPLSFIGAAILFVGWFGFNAGSALSAGGGAALAMLNTFTATAGAALAWVAIEALLRGTVSALGVISGMVAGLVAVTPAAGFVGPVAAIGLGAVGSAAAYVFVTAVKQRLGYDDSLDVFGIHGVAGIVGALGTGILAAPSLGGMGYAEGVGMAAQLWVQVKAVLVTILWCGVVSFALYRLVDALVGLRATAEAERRGLDLTSQGEAAYHM